ncbi:TetR/AcrR family transcriptional regulator [Streptomyces capparidis]
MSTAHSGSGDVPRSMELLWGTAARPSRGPRPGLTLERIVTAAVAVADAEGIGALSMRRVAAELGVGTMSLYRYLPGKGELLDLMLDRVSGEDLPPRGERPEPGAGWRAEVEAAARRSWALYHRHPWLLQVDQARPLLGPNAVRGVERFLSGIDGVGLGDREMVAVLALVGSFVAGMARDHLAAVEAERRTGVSDADFWAAQVPVLGRVLRGGDYPTLARIGEDAWQGGEFYFEFGLQRLLDGLDAHIAARAAARESAAPGSPGGPGEGGRRGSGSPGST